MATQATEKLLKGYLLFTDRSLSGDAKKVRDAVARKAKELGRTQDLGHDVEACIDLASAAGLPGSTDLKARIEHINSYYSQRYPDAAQLQSLSTGEVDNLDEAIFEIWDAFESINDDYYYTCGVSMPIYAVQAHPDIGAPNPLLQNLFQKLILRNKAYEKRRDDLEAGIRQRLTEWYPSKSGNAG